MRTRREDRKDTDEAIYVDGAGSIDEVPTLAWVVISTANDIQTQHEQGTADVASLQRDHHASVSVLSFQIGKIFSMCSGLTELVVWFRTSAPVFG